MELRQLEYFVTVSDLSSFTKAAQKLYLTQPTITNSINNLEMELGVKLFVRSTRQVTLTNEGRAFYNYSTNVLKEVYAAREGMAKMSESRRNVINIAVNSFLCASHFLPVLRQYKEENGASIIQFQEHNWSSAEALFEAGRFDMAIMLGQKQDFPADSICLRKGFLRSSGRLSLEEAPRVLLINEETASFNKQLIQQNLLPDHTSICYSSCTHTLELLSREADTVAFLPDFLRPELPSVDAISLPEIEASLFLLFHKQTMTPLQKSFLDFLVDHFKR